MDMENWIMGLLNSEGRGAGQAPNARAGMGSSEDDRAQCSQQPPTQAGAGVLCMAHCCSLLRPGPHWPWAVLGEVTKGWGRGKTFRAGLGAAVTGSRPGWWEEDGRHGEPGGARLVPGSTQGSRAAGWLPRACMGVCVRTGRRLRGVELQCRPLALCSPRACRTPRP